MKGKSYSLILYFSHFIVRWISWRKNCTTRCICRI